MKPLPMTGELEAIARRVVWFEPPEEALADPVRFLAYAAGYASFEDMAVIRRYFTDDEFRAALDNAPPGIVPARAWSYWNVMLGRYPVPPQRTRQLPGL